MQRIQASAVYQVEGVAEDPRCAERARRLLTNIDGPAPVVVSDAELNEIAGTLLPTWRTRHGMARPVSTTVILNRFRFDDEETERRRREAFPNLTHYKLNGYGGYDWRNSGSPTWREQTGLVCFPAYQIHTVVGCGFRCAYCSLGYLANLMLNLEEYAGRLDERMKLCPDQTLFQHDNFSDIPCFEPEYGSSRLFVEFFAAREGRYLELYVGKSDHVDYLLDLDHRGKTVCCWSIAGRTQASLIERGAASMEGRVTAARKCQEAGYPVRFRFSPIVPVRDWQRENREMIERIFAETQPDMITMEPLRYLGAAAVARDLGTEILDPRFVAAIQENEGKLTGPGTEIPDALRSEMYRFIFDELARVSPKTPVAFCRERRTLWDQFAPEFARWGQTPDDYVCNCGPWSDPASALRRVAAAA